MSDHQPYDPKRALSAHRAQERAAWDRYAAAAMNTEDRVDYAAERADAMLAERRRRFPGPRFVRAEEDAP